LFHFLNCLAKGKDFKDISLFFFLDDGYMAVGNPKLARNNIVVKEENDQKQRVQK
jgi:hypothetical protein